MPVAEQDFHSEIVRRLRTSDATPAQMALALAALQQIRWYSIGPDLNVCSKTAVELANELGVKTNNFPDSLKLLESVGAIYRVLDGREKVICLSPEYAEAERKLGRYREITLPLFAPVGKYGYKAGATNLRGVWRQFRKDLAELIGSQKIP